MSPVTARFKRRHEISLDHSKPFPHTKSTLFGCNLNITLELLGLRAATMIKYHTVLDNLVHLVRSVERRHDQVGAAIHPFLQEFLEEQYLGS